MLRADLMQPEALEAIYRYEKVNWWFIGRYQLIEDFFVRYSRLRNSGAKLLDVGCGTGAMLEKMQAHATTFGIDVSPLAMRFCRERGQHRLSYADGTRLPYADGTFDCIISLDVVEHIPDDDGVMREMYRVLGAGGFALITVPAHPFLWTTRDVRLMHQRRYVRPQLAALAERAGFQIERCTYYCAFFFPALAGIVLLNRVLGRQPDVKQDVVQPAPLINAVLRETLLMEQRLMRWLNLPFGVSLVCVLRKPANAD